MLLVAGSTEAAVMTSEEPPLAARKSVKNEPVVPPVSPPRQMCMLNAVTGVPPDTVPEMEKPTSAPHAPPGVTAAAAVGIRVILVPLSVVATPPASAVRIEAGLVRRPPVSYTHLTLPTIYSV